MHCTVKQTGDDCPTLKIGVVLLAAGEGSRLGGLPKSLIKLQGETLIHRHLQTLHAVGIDDIVVVTGYYFEAIEAALLGQTITIVRNPTPKEGQQLSVRLGLTALSKDCDLILVMLADQPLLNRDDVLELISAFKHRPTNKLVVLPEVHGQRGNPVCFSAELIYSMLASPEKISFRNYIDQNPNSVHKHLTTNEHFVIDLDTNQDVTQFEKRTGLQLVLPSNPSV
jgi:CTP:molybdopterin cytidylyltransferase MocA